MGFNSAFKGLKIVKNPGNGRLNNLNDRDRPQCVNKHRSRWPCHLRRRSTFTRLLGLRVSIPTGGMDVSLLSVRGLCDEPINRPEKSYRVWCVYCDVGTLYRRPRPTSAVEPWEENLQQIRTCME